MCRLKDKVAVIYSNGTIAAATALRFAEEGARVYLAGRTQKKLAHISNLAKSKGFIVNVSQLDVLDEDAVVKHMEELIRQEGRVDISFNGIGLPQSGIQGTPLASLDLKMFSLPIETYTKAHFITGKTAARFMSKQGAGVIVMHTPNASRVSPPFVGGMVPAWAAIEALCRSLSVELGDQGVRSVCLLTTGIPETPLIDEVWEIHGKAHGITFEQFHGVMESATHRKKLTTLKEFTDAMVFVASDEGTAISGTILNLTAGMIID